MSERCEHTVDMFDTDDEATMKKEPWTEEDDAKLIELCGTGTSVEIGEAMGRSSSAVRKRIQKLRMNNISEDMQMRMWTTDEIELLSEMRSKGMKAREIAKRLGRDVDSVHCKVTSLNRSGWRISRKRDSEEERQTMWDDKSLMGLRIPLNELASVLG